MNKILSRARELLKKETVLCVSLAAALISMIFVPPSSDYLGYVDWSVPGLLFCLMAVVKGFDGIGSFKKLSGTLTTRFHNTRSLGAALTLLCFFLAMLVTNDVSLITLVPLTITLFRGQQEIIMRTVVLETAAANLGSMATPVGNPQNLYIYTHYNMSIGDFFAATLPPTIISLALISASCLLIPSKKLETSESDVNIPKKKTDKKQLVIYSLAALVCLCTVLRLLDWRICLAAVVVLICIANPRVFKRVDYALLLTFICFFVFVGNLSAIPTVSGFISEAVSGREMLVGALLSQVISNVPCAVMLSGFTDNAKELLLGVDLGGLGTLIASLASLISFKLYGISEGAQKGKYFLLFTVCNFALLIVLYAAELGVMNIIY